MESFATKACKNSLQQQSAKLSSLDVAAVLTTAVRAIVARNFSLLFSFGEISQRINALLKFLIHIRLNLVLINHLTDSHIYLIPHLLDRADLIAVRGLIHQ